jgi:hypothetical protein
MGHDTTMDTAKMHPAPQRERIGAFALLFAVLAPPLAWSIHLIVNFAFSSHACFPAAEPLNMPLAQFHWLWGLLITIDIVSIAIGAVSIALAYRVWTDTLEERAESGPPLMEAGEGRTRFLAIWGILIGAGFVLAVVFDFVGLWILPICG